ncbi:alkaline phosphatase family protein-like protein [Amylocarpus encephaloides]|uniref:Alkaline phosphatase family protein-like protein n=1 Tax=Amylocarpus encephaloides TaxID=45428 RepID=A0A9P7YN62_9HELO|nr:alkaline phosphatase family protein-like protein [Amylocarpus encephaloides]
MSSLQDKVVAGSSIALRIATYIFLRIIPGHHFPLIIYTFFALYVPTFLASYLTQPRYDVLADELDISVVNTEVEDQPPDFPSTAAHSSNLPAGEKPTYIEEDIAIEETVIFEEKSARPWRTMLTGLPSPTSTLLSLATFLINTLLVLAATDLVYRAKVFHPSNDISFARMGYISPTQASLLIREPEPAQLPIFVSYKLADKAQAYENPAWQSAGVISALGNDTDYTGVVTFPIPSHPDRTYKWTTSNNHTGYFTVPPKAGQVGKRGSFTFLTSSCIKPHFPYNPLDHPLSIPGFRHMAEVINSILGGAQFMLFLGDFIYIDVPKRFGVTVEDYRREYRQVYSSPDWPLVGQNLSWIHVLDDHEIANDWDGNTTGVYRAAADPWHHYQTSVNPPRTRQAGTYSEPKLDATWFEFTQGPASFFMMDTRTYRDASADLPKDSTEKTMLGNQQLTDLLAFLSKPEPKGVKWKIVATSIPFTKNWRINSLDTWAGYLNERQVILEAMWDVGLRGGVGVVVLSGDRHEFAATAFPPPVDGKWPVSATVNEFSTSPLSQFYLPTPTYRQMDEEDVMVKYIPNGNSKLGAISIDNTASDQSILKFRLYVDGVETWSSVLLSPPVVPGKKWGKDALWG